MDYSHCDSNLPIEYPYQWYSGTKAMDYSHCDSNLPIEYPSQWYKLHKGKGLFPL